MHLYNLVPSDKAKIISEHVEGISIKGRGILLDFIRQQQKQGRR